MLYIGGESFEIKKPIFCEQTVKGHSSVSCLSLKSLCFYISFAIICLVFHFRKYSILSH